MRPDLPTGTVTFVFTDVEGSTSLLNELGAVAYADALADHRAMIRGACMRNGGVEVASRLAGAALAFAGSAGFESAAMTPFTAHLDDARAALGERAWQKALDEGAAPDLDAALRLVLDR